MVCLDVDLSTSARDTNYKSIPLTRSRSVIASLIKDDKFVEYKKRMIKISYVKFLFLY